MEEVSWSVDRAIMAEMIGLKKAPPAQVQIKAKNTPPKEWEVLIMKNPLK